MANQTLFYFYAPTWDYPPEGPIKLGNIITSVKSPTRPLCTIPPPSESDVYSTEKRKVVFSEAKARDGHFSILTKFLSFLGVGIDASASLTTNNETLYKFDRMETIQFFPEKEYLQRCIEAEPARRYLEVARYRRPLYVITGLKIVRGAEAQSLGSRAVGGSIGVEIDGTIWSSGTIPVGGGPEIGGTRERRHGTVWGESSDFVLAFRVRRVTVAKKTVSVKLDDDYRIGAMLGDEVKALHAPALTIDGTDDAEDEGLDREEVMDGEMLVSCAFPSRSTLGQPEWASSLCTQVS